MKRGTQDYRMVHKLVKKTAKEIAGCYYEFAAHDDVFYNYYPSMQFFIDYEWQKFVYHAKQTLTDCLRAGRLSETEKADIYEALLADSTLPYSPQETQITNVPH